MMKHTTSSESPPPRREGAGTVPIAILPLPLLELDRSATIVASSGVLERELGAAASWVGRRLTDMVTASTREAVSELLSSRTGGESRLTFPTERGDVVRHFDLHREGEKLWLAGRPVERVARREMIESEGEHADADATERARLSDELHRAHEELEQSSRALEDATTTKAQFLATMSHELRTPLNAVLGYAGLLRDGVYGAITDQQDRAVRAIIRRAKDLQLLIDDVLDLSKIEGGHLEMHSEAFDPAAVLYEVKDAITTVVRDKPLTIAVRTTTVHRVYLDRGKYRQIVLNLAANAVKFTPRHGEVELAVERGATDGQFVTRVRDTGIGIGRENLQRIFEHFQQVDTGTTRRYQGLGLGLSIVRRVVELLGGTVSVQSEPGSGATFVVTLPTGPEPEDSRGDMAASPMVKASPDDPVIVAIDDDPEVITLMRESLAPAHFRVVGARSGDHGLELARELHPLAITLDIMMPEKDGWQVLREIRADPDLSRIPVIIMSIVSERSLGYSLGVADYLVKPVERRVLIDTLERLRHRRDGRRALVVDGDDDARTLMRDLLDSLGFTVDLAARSDEAIATLARDVPDVLFVDTGMPERDVSLLLDTVTRDPNYAGIRIILVTPHSHAVTEHPEWIRRAAATVEYHGRERPYELLRELSEVIGA